MRAAPLEIASVGPRSRVVNMLEEPEGGWGILPVVDHPPVQVDPARGPATKLRYAPGGEVVPVDGEHVALVERRRHRELPLHEMVDELFNEPPGVSLPLVPAERLQPLAQRQR